MKVFLAALIIAGVAVAASMAYQGGTLALPPRVIPEETLEICRYRQPNTSDKTCIVDGDTLWLQGVNIRLRSFDTPEGHTNICGGATEVALADAATVRLKALLNENTWTIETFGIDNTGSRRLATVRIGERDVGDILIEEGLARRWPDGDEFWCR